VSTHQTVGDLPQCFGAVGAGEGDLRLEWELGQLPHRLQVEQAKLERKRKLALINHMNEAQNRLEIEIAEFEYADVSDMAIEGMVTALLLFGLGLLGLLAEKDLLVRNDLHVAFPRHQSKLLHYGIDLMRRNQKVSSRNSVVPPC